MKLDLPTGRAFTWLVVALLAVGIGVSYSGSFGVGFYFDDTYGISKNPSIRSLKNIPSYFVDPYAIWTDHTQLDLRPVLLATYALNYCVSGVQPWSYHLLNLFIHLGASLLVFVLVRDHVWWPEASRGPTGDARWPAAVAAVIFAVAPLNSQPVVYIWARSALLCVALYLGAFLAYLRGRRVPGSALLVLALLTKAIAVTLPVMLLVHGCLYRDRSRYRTVIRYLRDWKRSLAPLLLPFVLVIGYLAYRTLLIPQGGRARAQESWVTPGIWLMSQWSALLYYVRLFLWPDALSADHGFPYTTSLLHPRAWIPLVVIAAWLLAALAIARRHPHVTFATLWYFVTLAPESTIAPLAEVINDHRPYIASALGLSVLVTWVLDRAASLVAPRRHALALGGACMALTLAAVPMNRYRSWQWSDGLRIWEDTARKSPSNMRAVMNLGLAYMQQGDLVPARRYFEKARSIAPTYAYVHMNLSVLEASEGHLDKAVQEAKEAVRLRPDLALTHFYAGSALQKAGRTGEAAAAYRKSLALDPRQQDPAAALSRLGAAAPGTEETLMADGLYAARFLNDQAAAAKLFREVLALNPKHYGATYQLAASLDVAGRPEEARPLWSSVLEMAVSYHDRDAEARARARLGEAGGPAGAGELASDVATAETLMKDGLDALYNRHEPASAARIFRSVLEINPTHYGATFQLAKALDASGSRNEAGPIWKRVLEMAESSHDAKTAEKARARLSGAP